MYHILCFEQKQEKYQSFLSENFQFFKVKFSIYLNRPVFVMLASWGCKVSSVDSENSNQTVRMH